jgi:hypothetical protein
MSQDPYIRAANKFPAIKKQAMGQLEKRRGQGKANKPVKSNKAKNKP